MKIEDLVILGIVAVALYRVFLWLREAARTPDPWGPELEAALEAPEAVPLCHDCLMPQQHNGWFCPECGAAVGRYCNWLPGVYIFSMGEAFRSGVTERFRLTWPIAAGYVLVSFHAFSCMAPICWIFLFKNLRENARNREHTDINGTESL